jgi:hypothetical protein
MPAKNDLLLSKQLRITIRNYIRKLRQADDIEPEKAGVVAKLLREYMRVKRLEIELEDRDKPSFVDLLEREGGPPMKKRHN